MIHSCFGGVNEDFIASGSEGLYSFIFHDNVFGCRSQITENRKLMI